MFKVGDIVTCRVDFGSHLAPILGQSYKIISINEWYIGIFCPNNNYEESRRLGIQPNWGIHMFRLATEIEKNYYNFPDRLESIIND